MTVDSQQIIEYVSGVDSTTAPQISVITPVYNGSNHVVDCLTSVARAAADKLISIEHILIDDGSTDNTVATIKETWTNFGKYNLCQCRLLQIPHSGRPSQVRNRGIEAARGKYIFCLDHDDVLLQNALRYLASYLDSSGKDVAYGDFLRSDGKLAYTVGKDYSGKNYPDIQAALYSLFSGEHFYQHSFMFTKRLWEVVGRYDEGITFGEDLDLCIRFVLAGHIPEHLPVTTHIHRDHAKNLTSWYTYQAVCPVRLAEYRAHFAKHRDALRGILAVEQFDKIQSVLGSANHEQIAPPDHATAIHLATQRRNQLLRAWNAVRHDSASREGAPGVSQVERAKIIGFVCELARNSQFHARLPTTKLLELINLAIRTKQIKLYFNHYGLCMGYVAWAFLSPNVEQRLLQGKGISLRIEEMRQGDNLWIIDFLVPHGSLPYVLRDMRNNLFNDRETVTYFRYKNGLRIAKKMKRSIEKV